MGSSQRETTKGESSSACVSSSPGTRHRINKIQHGSSLQPSASLLVTQVFPLEAPQASDSTAAIPAELYLKARCGNPWLSLMPLSLGAAHIAWHLTASKAPTVALCVPSLRSTVQGLELGKGRQVGCMVEGRQQQTRSQWGGQGIHQWQAC